MNSSYYFILTHSEPNRFGLQPITLIQNFPPLNLTSLQVNIITVLLGSRLTSANRDEDCVQNRIASPLGSQPELSKKKLRRENRLEMIIHKAIAKRFAATIILLASGTTTPANEPRGQAIYLKLCAECHGENGEGVSGAYDTSLAGDFSQAELSEIIDATMPEGDPEACQGEDAREVARFIRDNFYSIEKNASNSLPRPALARLTGEQLRQSLADLYGHFQGNTWTQNDRGVAASYFEGSRWNKEKLRVERTDPVINFDFGKEAPVDGASAEEFFIQWNGSLKVDHSGRYEIILRSSLSCMFKFGSSERTLVNNHVQSEGKDEFRRTLYLTGGRVYPFTLDFIQRKRKTEQPAAKVSLSWIPPSGTEEIIPERYLIPNRLPATFSLQTKLPPDDRSYGYERGTSVSRQWDDSTTNAALEFAEIAKSELYPKFQRSNRDIPDGNRQKLKGFLEETLQTALRGPLSEETRTRYIEEQLSQAEDDGEAIKRSLLISLKSPRFLYPGIDSDRSESQRRANRLALVLYDSLPADPWLTQLIGDDKIVTESEIRQTASKMLRDYRAQAKIRSFLYQWLDLGDLEELSKDQELYPGFDTELVQHLRGSLDATIDEILSSGGNFQDLLLADWAMTTPKINEFYGAAWAPELPPIEHETPRSTDTAPAPQVDIKDPSADEQPQPQDASQVPPPVNSSPSAGSENQTNQNAQADPESPQSDATNEDLETESASTVEPRKTVNPLRFAKSVRDPQVHAGLLTHPLIMSHLAYFRTSSPIHRGVFLTRYTLGRVLRPPNEAFTPINPELHPDLTTRQRVDLQTGEVNCQVCHRKINSLGFALEAFDAAGRFRTVEKSQPLDLSGGYQPRVGKRVEFNGARELAEYLANSPDSHEAFVETAFEFFVKQPINAFGKNRSRELTDFFRENDFNIEKLITEIAFTASQLEPQP